MDQPKEIAKAVSNFILRKEDKIAADRMEICKVCEHFTRFGLCGYCKCAMAVKVRNENLHCPINKW